MFARGTLQTRILLLVLLVIIVTLTVVGWAISRIVYDSMEKTLGTHALEIARFVAKMPEVKKGMLADNPPAILQPLASELLEQTSASFIVLMNMDAIRYSHPNPDLIGKRFTGGDEGPALQGHYYTSRAVGISGPSIRGFAPIYDDDGRQLGVAAVGMFQENVMAVVRKTQLALVRALLLGLLVGIPGAVLLARAVKKTMYGMEPEDIATLLEQREAMLNCLREGVIFTDRDDRIALVNEAARNLLGLPPDVVGKKIEEVIPTTRMPQVRKSGVAEYDQQQRINDVVILTNRKPVVVNDEVVGVVATLRDKTEIQKLAEELTGVRRYVDALRAKTHEFMNKLHVISGLLELEAYDEAREFILQTTKKQQNILHFLTRRVKDPATVGLLLGKARQAEELAIEFQLDPKTRLDGLPPHFPSDAMVLVLGNFLENALEAITSGKKPGEGQITVAIYDEPEEILVRVEDNGPGIPPEIAQDFMKKGISSKDESRGYGLYLVSHQVEELSGGRISIKNKPGGGVMAQAIIPKVLPMRGETDV